GIATNQLAAKRHSHSSSRFASDECECVTGADWWFYRSGRGQLRLVACLVSPGCLAAHFSRHAHAVHALQTIHIRRTSQEEGLGPRSRSSGGKPLFLTCSILSL